MKKGYKHAILSVAILSLFLPLFAGCRGKKLPTIVKAEGVVTLDGNPIENATISFISERTDYHAIGNTDAQGKFAMRVARAEYEGKIGACPGDYKVEISKTVMGDKTPGKSDDEPVSINLQNAIPLKYTSISTSNLVVTVPDNGSDQLNFDLKSK